MTQFHHPLPFGAELQQGGGTRFRLWAPSADNVRLRTGGNDAAMRAEAGGWHSLDLAEAGAGTAYSFVLPDGLAVTDPASRMQQDDVHGPSVVIDPGAYQWRHADWAGRPWHEAVIYEAHAGIMGGFEGVRARLGEIAALGFTVLELMPLADVPGPRNWGYDGVLPYAPDRALGTPDQLKALIDEAHGLGLMVMLDVVYNHFGPDGAYIHAFAKPFFRDDIKTPWGASIDFRRPEVRDYFIQNALYWMGEYRFDGLRMDAVHAISEEDFLVELAGTVRAATAGRHVHLVLEHENNRAALLEGPAKALFDAQWADDFHHCLHVLLTGDSEGYYEDFQDATGLLARCLEEGFAYQGQLAPHLGRARGEPSGHLPPTAFVVCLQNHDQIGNRAMGERLTVLAEPGALRAATVLLLMAPFIPLVFMGEEHASTSPFLFFTSHNEELAKLVDEGRRAEFKSFSAFQDEARRAAIPAPNAEETFAASKPARTDPEHARWMAELLRLRAAHVVPGIPGCRSAGATVLAPGAVRAAWRLGTGETLTVLLNLGARTVEASAAAGAVLHATPGTEWEGERGRLPPGAALVLLG